METVNTGEGITIREASGNDVRQERQPVPAAVYEAVYAGLRTFMEKTPWSEGKEVKCVRIRFNITLGPCKARAVFFKGALFQDDNGAWVVGEKSKLAEVIRTVSGGKTLDKSHEGAPVFIEVTNVTSKKADPETGKFRVFDSVVKVMAKPAADGTRAKPVPAQAQTAQIPAPSAKPAQRASAEVSSNSESSDLLDSLTELGDFK